MAVYNWATNPGTRVAPSAGQKASGFVPATPASAENMNDVLGEITDALVPLNTNFAVQHNPATGDHTTVTATSVSSANFNVQSGGQYLTNFLSGGGGVSVAKFSHVTQQFALGDPGNTGDIVVYGLGGAGQNMQAIEIEPTETCRFILGQHPFNSDLENIILNMGITSTNTYDLAWDLQYFDFVACTWTSLVTSVTNAGLGGTGSLTGVAGVSNLVARTITLADQGSVWAPGNGFHMSGPFLLALKLTNNDATFDVNVYAATTSTKTISIENVIGGT